MAWAESCRDDEGFTLVELIVTSLLVGLVTLILFSTSDALTRIAATTQSRSATLADARLAVERIARDMRAANPINPLQTLPTVIPTSTYDTTVSFSVYCTSGNGCNTVSHLRPVSYSLDTTTRALTQTIGTSAYNLVGPQGTPTLAANLRRGAVVNGASEPVFTYYRRDGTQILTSPDPAVANSEYFRDCTKTVQIHLKVRAEPNQSSRVIDIVTTVNLRNYNEVNPC